MEEIRELLKGHSVFKAADPDQQKRLLSGQQLYVGGFRSTLKLVDLDEEYFDGMYAYLSAQVHITPSSFYWTHKRLNFGSWQAMNIISRRMHSPMREGFSCGLLFGSRSRTMLYGRKLSQRCSMS